MIQRKSQTPVDLLGVSTDYGTSISTVTTNVGAAEPVQKKKFAPTIPPTRPSKKIAESVLPPKRAQFDSRKGNHGMARVHVRGSQSMYPLNSANQPSRLPAPVPYKKPELIQVYFSLIVD